MKPENASSSVRAQALTLLNVTDFEIAEWTERDQRQAVRLLRDLLAIVDGLQGQIDALEQQNLARVDTPKVITGDNPTATGNEAIRAALRSLVNEVDGLLHLAEVEMRSVAGHTNVNCVKRRVLQARAALGETNAS